MQTRFLCSPAMIMLVCNGADDNLAVTATMRELYYGRPRYGYIPDDVKITSRLHCYKLVIRAKLLSFAAAHA